MLLTEPPRGVRALSPALPGPFTTRFEVVASWTMQGEWRGVRRESPARETYALAEEIGQIRVGFEVGSHKSWPWAYGAT